MSVSHGSMNTHSLNQRYTSHREQEDEEHLEDGEENRMLYM